MPILTLSRDWGVSPCIVRMSTSDNFAAITANGYLATQLSAIENLQHGTFEWLVGDNIAITYSDGNGLFTMDVNGNLVATVEIPPGSITTAMLQNGCVTYPKIQNVSANTVLGQSNVTGVVEEIPCTAFARTLIAAPNQAAAQVILGLAFPWNVIGVNTPLLVNNGYFSAGGMTINLTLPTVCAIGDTIKIANLAGNFSILQNAGQSINFGVDTTTIGVGGSITSMNKGDSIEIVCYNANTDFQVLNSMGNFTYI